MKVARRSRGRGRGRPDGQVPATKIGKYSFFKAESYVGIGAPFSMTTTRRHTLCGKRNGNEGAAACRAGWRSWSDGVGSRAGRLGVASASGAEFSSRALAAFYGEWPAALATSAAPPGADPPVPSSPSSAGPGGRSSLRGRDAPHAPLPNCGVRTRATEAVGPDYTQSPRRRRGASPPRYSRSVSPESGGPRYRVRSRGEPRRQEASSGRWDAAHASTPAPLPTETLISEERALPPAGGERVGNTHTGPGRAVPCRDLTGKDARARAGVPSASR